MFDCACDSHAQTHATTSSNMHLHLIPAKRKCGCNRQRAFWEDRKSGPSDAPLEKESMDLVFLGQPFLLLQLIVASKEVLQLVISSTPLQGRRNQESDADAVQKNDDYGEIHRSCNQHNVVSLYMRLLNIAPGINVSGAWRTPAINIIIT